MISKFYIDNPNPKIIEELVKALKNGEVIILSTGLTYAYACSVLNKKAIEKIGRLKNVNWEKKPMAIICSSIQEISNFTFMNNQAYSYIKETCLEPITYILPPQRPLPHLLRKKKEIGIRLSQVAEISYLLEQLGEPMLTASLPIRDQEYDYLLHPELVEERYGKDVYSIIDTGTASGGRSAIVRLINGEIEEVRPYESGFQYLEEMK